MIGRVLFLMMSIVGVLLGLSFIWSSTKKLLFAFRFNQLDEKPVSHVAVDETVKLSGTVQTVSGNEFVDDSIIVDDENYVLIDWELLRKQKNSWSHIDEGVDNVPILLEGEDMSVIHVDTNEVERVLIDSFDDSSVYIRRDEDASENIIDILNQNNITYNCKLQVRRDCLKKGDSVTIVGHVKESDDPRSQSRFVVGSSDDSNMPFTITDWSKKRFLLMYPAHVGGIVFGFVTLLLGIWLLVNDLIVEVYPDYTILSLFVWIILFGLYITGIDFVYWINSKVR